MKRFLLFTAGVALAVCVQARVDASEVAKSALAQKRYGDVVEAYTTSTAAGQPLSDADHYRLAIAYNALERPMLGWKHLQDALGLNKAGTFASSPARLAALRESILAGCARASQAGCVAADRQGQEEATGQSIAMPVLPAPSRPFTSETAVQPAAASPVVAPVPPTGDLVAKPELRMETLAAPSVTRDSRNALLIVVSLQTAAILLLVWLCWALQRRPRTIEGGRAGVERLRDDVAAMLHRLANNAQGRASDLYRHLSDILPHLEQESGRVAFRELGNARALAMADRQTADLVKHLSLATPDVLHSSAADIEAVFRRRIL
jgi:hypothetical protein